LGEYSIEICDEWIYRGYKDNCRKQIVDILMTLPFKNTKPNWLGKPDLHASHRSNLLRKDPNHYNKWFHGEPSDLPYVWPV